MNGRPKLMAAPPPFEPEFGTNGALRQAVGASGRVHLDRWLPFLILHRSEEPATSLARRIATDSSAYMVWSPDDDLAALSALEAVASAAARGQGRLLVVTLADQPVEFHREGSQDLPPFVAQVGAGDQGDAGRAAAALEAELRDIEIDLRSCKVGRVPFEPLLPKPFDGLLSAIDGDVSFVKSAS